jgi:hypothetical protein
LLDIFFQVSFYEKTLCEISLNYQKSITLFDDGITRIDHFINGNKTVVVTFSEAPNVNLDGYGYAGHFFTTQSVDLVAVKSSKANYFQNLTHELFSGIFAKYLSQYERRVSYGCSMGGFGSYVFSKDLQIDLAICISARIPEDAQLIDKDVEIKFSVDNVTNDKTVFVCVYDPYDDIDKHCIKKILQQINKNNFKEYRLPFSGHPATYYMYECGVIKNFSVKAIQGEITGIDELFYGRRSWSKSTIYLYNLSRACLKRKKLNTSLALIDRLIKLDPNNTAFLQHKKRVLDKLFSKNSVN